MTINIGGDCNVTMSQSCRDCFQCSTVVNQKACITVPQLMYGNRRKPIFGTGLLKILIDISAVKEVADTRVLIGTNVISGILIYMN